MAEEQSSDMRMSSISHPTLLCMIFIFVLCSISSVSAITITDAKNTVTVTGENGLACIPEEITLYGTTNYNTDNRVIVEISSADFAPTSKAAPQHFGGAVATVDVQKGTGINYWTMSANTAGWEPGMYLVQATVVGKELVESEFITLSYCSDVSQVFPSASLSSTSASSQSAQDTLETKRDSEMLTSKVASTQTSTSSSATDSEKIDETGNAGTQSSTDENSGDSSSAEPQTTPRSPSWFGLAVLACLGAGLIRKI